MTRERYLHRLDPQGLMGRRIPCLEKGNPALLVLDMQDFFLNPHSHAFIPSGPELIPVIVTMADAFRAAGLPVVYTRHLNEPEDAGSMGRWWRDLIRKDDPLSRINEAFDTHRAHVVVKTQYDAFLGTGLQDLLRNSGTTSVVITGVMTNLCCETTARAAFTRGFDVVFPVDCTATLNQELHNATILNLSHGFAEPVCSHSVMEALGNAR